MSPSPIAYSVILCTRNRAALLSDCLDSISIAMQHCSPSGEIVIVDNGSRDDTQAVARAWITAHAVPVQLSVERNVGLSHARNHGIGLAHGPLLLFIDDDCRMDPAYLSDALRYDAADNAPVLRGGSVHLGDSTDQPHTIKTRSEPQHWSRGEHSARHDNLGNSILGCNMAMRRTLVDAVGLFDVNLGVGSAIPGGEDTDYVLRSYLAGFIIAYAPDMRVYHHHGRKLLADAATLTRNYSIGGGALYAKYLFRHPGLCRQLYWDSKTAVKELLTRSNRFEPALGVTMRSKLAYNIRGMLRYWLSSHQ